MRKLHKWSAKVSAEEVQINTPETLQQPSVSPYELHPQHWFYSSQLIISSISSLEDKVAKLEQSATILSRAKWSSQPPALDGSPSTVGNADIMQSVNFDTTQDGGIASKCCTPDGLTQQTSYARNFLQQEIEAGEMLPEDRSAVLKEAATLVDQISNTANMPLGADYRNAPEVDDSLLSRDLPKELLYLVTLGE